MLVSVIICTRNRAQSLSRTMGTLASLENVPQAAWELVIVDNGSSDHTARVIEAHAHHLPIRSVSEPLPGLSRARNRGILAARGDYILWTDDDVDVSPGWLRSYLDAFAEYPQASVFGGNVVPVLESPAPRWFADNIEFLAKFLAARDFGPEFRPLTIDGDVIPFGANFAVRARDQRCFPYDETVGAGSGIVAVGEETSVIKAMLRAGLHGIWVPAAQVKHRIGRNRMTRNHVKRWFISVGFIMERDDESDGRRIFGVPRWILREFVTRGARYHVFRFIRPSRRWLEELACYSVARGRIAYWLSTRRPRVALAGH